MQLISGYSRREFKTGRTAEKDFRVEESKKSHDNSGGVGMILYHGSVDRVERPEIRQGKVYLDFGIGFYTTTSFEQAERWAKIKMRRNNTDIGFVSVYEFDFEKAKQELAIETF